MALEMQTNSLAEYWLPFTDNRGFRRDPRIITSARGLYLTDLQGRQIIDGSSGLFCSPAGHCHPRIIAAVHEAMQEMTYVSPFGTAQPLAFALAERVARLLPEGMDHVFFVNSGSEAIDTAIKIVMAYHAATGERRYRFVSRERAYHGVNIGGTSLAGIVNNRRAFPVTMPWVVHMRHTWTEEELFVPGQRRSGADRAEDLQRFCDTYGGESIAAVFIEPVAGSTGTLPPPVGYLERIREICDEHGILLVFDDVICGFGRIGGVFSADAFGVTPDIVTMAKALTNGSIPMGAVGVSNRIHDTIIDAAPEGTIEFFHGYTYSAHPAACAAGLAALAIYEEEGLFARARTLDGPFAEAVLSLADHPLVRDIRVIGLLAGLELRPGARPGARGALTQKLMFENGLHVKFTGDTGLIAPMFIAEQSHLEEIVARTRTALDGVLATEGG